MEKNNKFYSVGFKRGVRYGNVKEYQRMILSDGFEDVTFEDMLSTMLEEDKAELSGNEFSAKNVNLYFLGYTDGRNNHIRNEATSKYQKKVGLVSKSYKLHKEVIDSFAETCNKKGVSYASQIEAMMKEFIEENKEKNEEDPN